MDWFTNHTPQFRPTSSRPVEPSGDLWDLVLDFEWDRVVEHAKEFPVDAAWTDGHWHETPLYLACQHNAPLRAIQAILDAYPDAVLSPSRANRDLPIHIACRYQANVGILKALLRDYPRTSVEQSRWGIVPILALWEFRSLDKPLDETFWNKVVVLLTAAATDRKEQFMASRPSDLSALQSGREGSKEDSLLLVHAAISLGSLGCPAEILEYLLAEDPEAASQPDLDGQLPLHIAVGPALMSSTTRRRYRPREHESIVLLLNAYPEAAKIVVPRSNGRYPLHVALTNRHTWDGGVQDLFQAAPEALLTPDRETKLYPFQLAAIPVRGTKVDLDTVYELLRAQPDVLGMFQVGKTTAQSIAPRTSHTRSLHRFRPVVDETILGTMTAICIGSVIGVVFCDT